MTKKIQLTKEEFNEWILKKIKKTIYNKISSITMAESNNLHNTLPREIIIQGIAAIKSMNIDIVLDKSMKKGIIEFHNQN